MGKHIGSAHHPWSFNQNHRRPKLMTRFYRSIAISILAITTKLTLLIGLSTGMAFAQPDNTWPRNWFEEELLEKQTILKAFWWNRIVQYNPKSVDDFKTAIVANHFPLDSLWQVRIEQLFADAVIGKINFNEFFGSLQDQPLVLVRSMNHVEKLIPENQFIETYPRITKANLRSLEQYVKDKQLSVSVTLGTAKARLITPAFPENQSNDVFSIHSVGKVFTGILALIMVRENFLSEGNLSQQVQLNETVKQQLPPAVREQLSKVTLHQLMTHKAGFGDYLGKYCDAIAQGDIPVIKNIEDFLPFVEDKTFPIGEFRYSNAGILLVGLAIKHAYEKAVGRPVDYNDILRKYIIDAVDMPSFSPWRPTNGKFNLQDPVAPHMVGSPAGGYWVTAEELAKFGQWIYRQSYATPLFKKLIEQYGQEFYDSENQAIVHGGGIASSAAFFSVSLKTGAILSMVSNQTPAQASDVKEMILRNIFFRKILHKDD